MTGVVRYVVGDATVPVGTGPRVIAHVCNDLGAWGRGFVTAVSRRWPEPEAAYRAWHRSGLGFALGAVQLVDVSKELWVANMIGQRGISRPDRKDRPVRYEAVATALQKLAAHCRRLGADTHMPRIGCGLAGGSWDRIAPLLREHVAGAGIDVTVYDLP